MILVAATGPVGSGKTTLLSRLVDWAKEEEKSADGFLAIAGRRATPDRGAEEYLLRRLSTGEEIPFLHRSDSRHPPYTEHPDAARRVAAWVDEIRRRPGPLSLLVLDEFGPLEAQGAGHLPHWTALRSGNPAVAVISVRDHLVEEIQTRLGLPFDVVIDTTSPKALRRLRAVVDQHPDWIRAGRFGAAAGGFEATVGAVLHGAAVPMRGLFLSTVQSLLMMYAADRMRVRRRVVWVPFISAGIKALSPSGSRLRPMLAISVQGILFSLSATVLGWNAAGVLLGGWLVGAWAAAQGIFLQYLFIGAEYFRAMDAVVRWLVDRLQVSNPGVTVIIVLWLSLWGTISSAVTLFAWSRRRRLPARLGLLLSRGAEGIVVSTGRPAILTALRQGVRDLARPFFWLPVVIVAAVIAAAGSSWEGIVWIAIRAVTVGWVFFSLARMIDPAALLAWLKRKGHWGPALALSRALRRRPGETPDDAPPAS